MKEKRVSTRVHTRKLDRSVAHKRMEKLGRKKVNKHDNITYKNPFGATITEREGSYFSKHWREMSERNYANM